MWTDPVPLLAHKMMTGQNLPALGLKQWYCVRPGASVARRARTVRSKVGRPVKLCPCTRLGNHTVTVIRHDDALSIRPSLCQVRSGCHRCLSARSFAMRRQRLPLLVATVWRHRLNGGGGKGMKGTAGKREAARSLDRLTSGRADYAQYYCLVVHSSCIGTSHECVPEWAEESAGASQ